MPTLPYYIRALLEEEPDYWQRWDEETQPLGSTVTLTYSFMQRLPSYYSRNDSGVATFSSMNSEQQQVAAQAMRLWAEVAQVQFNPVDNNSGGVIRFANTSIPGGSAGWAYSPGETNNSNTMFGDVWINIAQTENDDANAEEERLEVFVHEVGHALGLQHPFGGSSTLPSNEENRRYSIMSYTTPSNGTVVEVDGNHSVSYSLVPTAPMLYDIAAIQYLYGANRQTRAGNDTYSWATNPSFFATIWDGGGQDTISCANQTRRNIIDLRAGRFSSIAYTQQAGEGIPDWAAAPATYDGRNNLALAFGVTIEHAIGGAANDTLIGNGTANRLDGRNGADRLQGGNGNDTYLVNHLADTVIEQSNQGNDTILASLSWNLTNHIENLTLTGSSATQATGNDLANRLIGNNRDNVLQGRGGNDLLDGRGGSDTLTGGGGADRFLLSTVENPQSLDTITDFTAQNGDQLNFVSRQFGSIALGTLPANRFVANATGQAQDELDRFVFNTQSGILSYDLDGSGARDAVAVFSLGSATIAASNIVIVSR